METTNTAVEMIAAQAVAANNQAGSFEQAVRELALVEMSAVSGGTATNTYF